MHCYVSFSRKLSDFLTYKGEWEGKSDFLFHTNHLQKDRTLEILGKMLFVNLIMWTLDAGFIV